MSTPYDAASWRLSMRRKAQVFSASESSWVGWGAQRRAAGEIMRVTIVAIVLCGVSTVASVDAKSGFVAVYAGESEGDPKRMLAQAIVAGYKDANLRGVEVIVVYQLG